MPRVSNIELLYTAEQPALCIRTHTPVTGLPRVIGESYAKLGAYICALGASPADVPFVAYHNMDMENLDVQMGFPMAETLPPGGDITYSPIPGGRRVFCIYRGPYADMAPVYDELAAYITQNGYEAQGTAYEYYFNGPDCPADELLTKIVMPIK